MLDSHLSRWFALPWPPGFFFPGCPCCPGVETYGYIAGGLFGSMSVVADKLAFSAETSTATTTANLSQARGQYPAGAGNPSIAGYFCGGQSAALTAVITADKLVFSTDTTSAATTADLDNTQSGHTAISERSTKGYYAGGTTTGNVATNITVTGHVLTFSSDSNSATTSVDLSQARYNLTGLTEGSSKGYWLGGGSSILSKVVTGDKLIFSSNTTSAQASANLSQARYEMCSASDGSTYGYVMGGNTGARVSTVDRLTFSTDTTAVHTTFSLNRESGAAMSDGVLAICGGTDGTDHNRVSKLTFATETMASFAGVLSASRNYYGAISQAAL